MRTTILLGIMLLAFPAKAQEESASRWNVRDKHSLCAPSNRTSFGYARHLIAAGRAGGCVTLEGIWADQGLLNDLDAVYGQVLHREDDPARVGLYVAEETASWPQRLQSTQTVRMRVTGRLGNCADLYAQDVGDEAIAFVTGYCHYFSGPFVDVQSAQIIGRPVVRLTGAHHRRRLHQLTEVDADWLFRDDVERRAGQWLALVVAGDPHRYVEVYGGAAESHRLLFSGDGSAAARLAQQSSPELRLWFSQMNMDAAASDQEYAVIACFKIGDWTDDRWPVAELDADARPNRPYACVELYRTAWQGEVSDFARVTFGPGGLAEPAWPE